MVELIDDSGKLIIKAKHGCLVERNQVGDIPIWMSVGVVTTPELIEAIPLADPILPENRVNLLAMLTEVKAFFNSLFVNGGFISGNGALFSANLEGIQLTEKVKRDLEATWLIKLPKRQAEENSIEVPSTESLQGSIFILQPGIASHITHHVRDNGPMELTYRNVPTGFKDALVRFRDHAARNYIDRRELAHKVRPTYSYRTILRAVMADVTKYDPRIAATW